MDTETKRYYWAVSLILVAAFAYALNSNLAAVSYAHGADPLSVLMARSIVGALGLYLVLKITKVPLKLPRRELLAAAGLGVFVALGSILILSAFQFIPVALAILIFFLFPLLTAVGAWACYREPLSPVVIAMLITALIGLALALDIGGGALAPKGVMLAAASAFVVALLMLLNGKLVRGRDSRPYTLIMLIVTALLFVAASLISGRFLLPNSPVGLAAYFGVAAAHSIAIIVMFIAVSMIGAVQASLFMNFEPVVTIILGALILGQILTPLQLLGAAIVIASVIIAGRQKSAHPMRK